MQLLGRALEGPDFSARPAADQWQTAVALFRTRRVLLVWDNFEAILPAFQFQERTGVNDLSSGGPGFDAAIRADLLRLYRDLTGGDSPAPQGRLLVTCRPAETGLPAIKELPLAGLARPDSLYLLRAIADLKAVDLTRPGCERTELDALLDLLADHPLSVELVAPHLKTLTPAEVRRDFAALLERFTDERAAEGRNRSLLASLEFSRRHLSPQAQRALPYLAWFEGGVFENVLLAFAEFDPEAWARTRAELAATALVSVEELAGFSTPYLRFHPTLPYAACREEVPDPEAAERAFIATYLEVMQAAHEALRGHQPAAGMALVAREEANLCAALARAFARGMKREGWRIASTLRDYLERAGRLRERNALTAWVKERLPADAGLDKAACTAVYQHAWSLCTQGKTAEAVTQVQNLIARLEAEGLAGAAAPAFHIGTGCLTLGRIHIDAHRPDLALEPIQKAIAIFEQLPGDAARSNLATALGDMANTYRLLGRFDAALADAERGLAIHRELDHSRDIAVGLGQIAQILTRQQRYAEAEARHDEALAAARTAGDLELQGLFLQYQGTLQREQNRYDRAVELYQQAIALFQHSGNAGEEMRTCALLATAELERGYLDAAEAWYAHSRELATALGDRAQLAANAQNVSILYQTRAEQTLDPAARADFIRRAVASAEESLAGWVALDNQFGAAAPYNQLGRLYLLLGDLDRAEKYLQQALHVYDELGLPDIYRVYRNLADIARARGDAQAAARWQAKRDAKVAELERLRRGEGAGERGGGGAGEQLARLVLVLAQAAYAARRGGGRLPPDTAEALAQLAQLPPPLGAIAPFLQAVAAGEALLPVPAGLPPRVTEILQALAQAA